MGGAGPLPPTLRGRAAPLGGGTRARVAREGVRRPRRPGRVDEDRAGVADPDRQRLDPGEGEEPGGRGRQAPGRRRWAQARKSRGAPSKAIAPASIAIDPVGGGEAALEPVLGEQDRHPPLLVEAAQQPDQLVAGDRVELGGRLVEEDQRAAG